MRNQLVALAIAVVYPIGAIAATTEGGAGMGTEAKKEKTETPAGASGSAGGFGSASGGTSAPETKASGSAKGKADAAVKKPDSGKAPEEAGARGQSSGGAAGDAK